VVVKPIDLEELKVIIMEMENLRDYYLSDISEHLADVLALVLEVDTINMQTI